VRNSVALREEHRLKVFQNRMVRRDDRVIAQAVSRWLPTASARVR
jgi:hypothetical protein